jgi:hypothetical protein
MKAGLKKWGERAKDAIKDELMLFIKEEVFEAVSEPNQQQITSALRMLVSLQKKEMEELRPEL